MLVFVIFLEQTTDRQKDLLFWVLRYPAHYTDQELLPKPPQKEITDYIQNIRLSLVSQ